MSVTYNKFNTFVLDLSSKVHNLAADQITVALTEVAPVATNHLLADLTQISYTNCSSRNVTTISASQTSGTFTLDLTNLTLTASGGAIAQFRYIALYNSTAAGGNLIGWFDTGIENNIVNGASYLIQFGASTISLT